MQGMLMLCGFMALAMQSKFLFLPENLLIFNYVNGFMLYW